MPSDISRKGVFSLFNTYFELKFCFEIKNFSIIPFVFRVINYFFSISYIFSDVLLLCYLCKCIVRDYERYKCSLTSKQEVTVELETFLKSIINAGCFAAVFRTYLHVCMQHTISSNLAFLIVLFIQNWTSAEIPKIV